MQVDRNSPGVVQIYAKMHSHEYKIFQLEWKMCVYPEAAS